MKEWLSNLGAGMMIIVVLCIIVAVFLFPLAQIWAVNTLAGTAIEYGFLQYVAFLVVNITLANKSIK